jgi:DNA-binding MarR family transcriptional regulator
MLEQQVGYRLKQAQHALRMQMDTALREIGLTTPQYAALSVLWEQPGLSGAALARRSFVTPQTMNTIIGNLEAASLLVRRSHPERGRVLQAYVTPQGETLLQEAHRRVRAIEEQMVTEFSPDELLQLMKALQACIDALETPSKLSLADAQSS